MEKKLNDGELHNLHSLLKITRAIKLRNQAAKLTNLMKRSGIVYTDILNLHLSLCSFTEERNPLWK